MMTRRTFLQLLSCAPLAGLMATRCSAVKADSGSIPVEYHNVTQGRDITIRRREPSTTTELYEMMCEIVPPGPSTDWQWAVTGEKYEEYAYGINLMHRPRDFDPEPALCRAMFRLFLKRAVRQDIDLRKTRLYFRIRPEISYWGEDNAPPKAKIYMRYLISDKPAEQQEIDGIQYGRWGYLPSAEDATFRELAFAATAMVDKRQRLQGEPTQSGSQYA